MVSREVLLGNPTSQAEREKTTIFLHVSNGNHLAMIQTLQVLVAQGIASETAIELVVTTEEERFGCLRRREGMRFGDIPQQGRKAFDAGNDALLIASALALASSVPSNVEPLLICDLAIGADSDAHLWRNNLRLQKMQDKERLRSVKKNTRDSRRG